MHTDKLRELLESRVIWLEKFSDDGQYMKLTGPTSGEAFELAHELRRLLDELDRLRKDAANEILLRIQAEFEAMAVPKMTEQRAEYWKAGARRAISVAYAAIDAAIAA